MGPNMMQVPNPLTPQGANQIDQVIQLLEEHLTAQLRNHKMFLDDIQSIEEERNFYYRKLRLVEEQCDIYRGCESEAEIMDIIENVPEDFRRVDESPQLKMAHGQGPTPGGRAQGHTDNQRYYQPSNQFGAANRPAQK